MTYAPRRGEGIKSKMYIVAIVTQRNTSLSTVALKGPIGLVLLLKKGKAPESTTVPVRPSFCAGVPAYYEPRHQST